MFKIINSFLGLISLVFKTSLYYCSNGNVVALASLKPALAILNTY
jgi:hypothetical protein